MQHAFSQVFQFEESHELSLVNILGVLESQALSDLAGQE